MGIDVESLKRVLGGMKTFARGERLKHMTKRMSPTDKEKLEAPVGDEPELMGVATDAEEANESPEEKALELGAEPVVKKTVKVELAPDGAPAEDDEASMIKKLLEQMGG